MDTRSIAAVLLKIAGLILIGACVTQLPSYFPVRLQGSDWSASDSVISAALTVGPAALLGVCLWLFPGTIANKVVGTEPGIAAPFEFRTILLVAVAVLGLFLIARGIVDIVYNVATFVQLQRLNADIAVMPATIFASLVSSAVELIIGLAFVLGRRKVAHLVERARG